MTLMQKSRLPLVVTMAYALAGAGWIVTGYFLSSTLYEEQATSLFELYKGLAFIAVTATVLFIALYYTDHRTAGEEALGEWAGEFDQSIRNSERARRGLPLILAGALALLLCLLLLGLAWMRENTLRAGERTADALHHAIAVHTGTALRIVDFTLAEIAQNLAANTPSDPPAELRRRLKILDPLARALWITDRQGRLIHATEENFLEVDLSRRDYFTHHRQQENSRFFIGNPAQSLTRDTWLVNVSHAIRKPSGEFLGVVTAALDTKRFERHWQMSMLGKETSVALFNSDDLLLMRSPHQEDAIGRSFRDTGSWQELSPQQTSGTYRAHSDIDGKRRIFALGRIPDYPLKIFIGIPENQVLAGWYGFAAVSLGIYLIAGGGLVLLAFILMRQIRKRLALQQRAAALARYPLQNRNPVLSMAANGEPLFLNEAARNLIQSTRGNAAGTQLDAALHALAHKTAPGSQELLCGERIFSVSYIPHPPAYCDIYLTDITTHRKDEALARLFFELPLIGMAVMLPKTHNWVYFNNPLCEILGYTRSQLAASDWMELTHPQDRAAEQVEYDRLIEGKSDGYNLDKRLIRADGTIIHVLSNIQVLRKPDHSIHYVVCALQDITERKHHEQQLLRQKNIYAVLSETNEAIVRLRQREDLFNSICRIAVERAGLAFAWIGLLDGANGMLHKVARFGEDHGYIDSVRVSTDPRLPIGRGPTGIALREGRHWINNDMAAAHMMGPWREAALSVGVRSSAAFPIRQGSTVIGVLNLYARESGYFTPEIATLFDQMATDLSYALDHLAAGQQLRESESKFKGLVEQSLVGIYILEGETLLYANPRTAEIFGHAAEEIIGQSMRPLIDESDWPLVATGMRKRLSGEVANVRCEFHGRRKDGTRIMLGTHGNRALFDGRPVILGVLQDITEKHQTEEKIQGYVQQLERSILSAVDAISFMVDLRDPYTAGHERRVGNLAAAIGSELGLNAHDIMGLRIAGYVHDVGKIAVPAEILAKPGRLSPAEFDIVKTHAEKGYEILKNIEFPWPVANAVWQHHERLNGQGYPRKLSGEQLIQEARILAVADVVESMATHRPYRPALGLEAALTEIETHAGTLFDAAVVAACLRLFREKHHQLSG